MLKVIFVLYLTFMVTEGHFINKAKIKDLEKLEEDYKKEQENIYKRLNDLETDMTQKIQSLASGGGVGTSLTCPDGTVSTCVKDGQGSMDIGQLEIKLLDLEHQMDEVLRYLTSEKEKDFVLKSTSSMVIKEMEGKVKEADNVILGLQESVDSSLDRFQNMIKEVNQSAQVTINSKGVVFYGGIGCSCSYDDECLTENSDCRSGRCQCRPGYSYNMDKRLCVVECQEYGNTYQSVDSYILRGYNNLTLKDVGSFQECKEQCALETNFTCVSIDYFPRWSSCYLSEVTALDVPDGVFEYNSAGIHFQRDCA